jgi:hypothetical protein
VGATVRCPGGGSVLLPGPGDAPAPAADESLRSALDRLAARLGGPTPPAERDTPAMRQATGADVDAVPDVVDLPVLVEARSRAVLDGRTRRTMATWRKAHRRRERSGVNLAP